MGKSKKHRTANLPEFICDSTKRGSLTFWIGKEGYVPLALHPTSWWPRTGILVQRYGD
jgi:hypothetical protein